MVVSLLLYGLRITLTPCNCFTLSLRVAIVGVVNHGGGATMSVVMEIMSVLWRWRSKAQEEKAISYHNLRIACDVNPFYAPYWYAYM